MDPIIKTTKEHLISQIRLGRKKMKLKHYRLVIPFFQAAEKYFQNRLIKFFDTYVNSANEVVQFSKLHEFHRNNIKGLLE